MLNLQGTSKTNILKSVSLQNLSDLFCPLMLAKLKFALAIAMVRKRSLVFVLARSLKTHQKTVDKICEMLSSVFINTVLAKVNIENTKGTCFT